MRTLVVAMLLGSAVPTARAESVPKDDRPVSELGKPPTQVQLDEEDGDLDVHDDEEVADGGNATRECAVVPVVLKRVGFRGPLALSLTTCDGQPSPSALAALSELAQPALDHAPPDDSTGAAPKVRQLNPGLLERLQRIADQYQGRTIEIVSGYRPRARPGSRHRGGDALDLRVEGVDNAELSGFVRSFAATGVGYYPTSGFVHMDVRKDSFYWVDSSAPGQPPAYRREPALEAPMAAPREAVAPGDPSVEPLAATQNAQSTAKPSAGDSRVTEPVAATQDQDPLDAELRGLAERALLVMNLALGRTSDSGSALPTRRAL